MLAASRICWKLIDYLERAAIQVSKEEALHDL
jgi:hypothetical protein